MINGDVLLTVDRVLLNNTTLADVQLDGSLEAGELLIERFALAGEAGGALAGSLQLTPTATSADFSLNCGGRQHDRRVAGSRRCGARGAASLRARCPLCRFRIDRS